MHLHDIQFVKKMGMKTEKSHVMVQPTVVIMREVPEPKSTCPATIVDKLNVGWLVKYFLVFDDDVVLLSLSFQLVTLDTDTLSQCNCACMHA